MPLPAPPYVIERVETPEALQELLDLRVLVFVKEQGFALELEKDAHDQLDETTAHFVLRLLEPGAGRPVVGTVRVHRYTEGAYKIGRICVRADCRKYGFGSVLVRRAEQWAREDTRRAAEADPNSAGAVKVTVRAVIESQEQAMPFYNRLGYEGEGEIFLDEHVLHRKMVKQLENELSWT